MNIMEPERSLFRLKPRPPTRISVSKARIGFRHIKYPRLTMRKLLDRLKEATSWAGFAILAQFLPFDGGQLDIIWQAIVAIAAAAAIFIPEKGEKNEKSKDG